jgi:hypothetical protein
MDAGNAFFYAETDKALTPSSGGNWMLLLIDADADPATGWHGYDFLVNKHIVDDKITTVMAYDPKNKINPWVEKARLPYKYKGNMIELAIPRKILGLGGNRLTFDYKWCDNPAELKDPISLCVDGDAAPNRRFNYRCIWQY